MSDHENCRENMIIFCCIHIDSTPSFVRKLRNNQYTKTYLLHRERKDKKRGWKGAVITRGGRGG
jgi:hypothetical protein